jgi:protein-tyrosine phosphatase
MDETVAYAQAAVRAGTERIVATPHVEHVDVTELPARVAEVRAALMSEGIELHVERGGELKPFSIPSLSQDELDLIAHGPPGRRWVLLEVPFRGLGESLLAAIEELDGRGFAALLAHPERAKRFRDSVPVLREHLDRGGAVQMNVGPLTGHEAGEREESARRLVRAGFATALATDAHPPGRPYTLRLGAELVVAAGASADDAARLVEDGPRELLSEGLSFRTGSPGTS